MKKRRSLLYVFKETHPLLSLKIYAIQTMGTNGISIVEQNENALQRMEQFAMEKGLVIALLQNANATQGFLDLLAHAALICVKMAPALLFPEIVFAQRIILGLNANFFAQVSSSVMDVGIAQKPENVHASQSIMETAAKKLAMNLRPAAEMVFVKLVFDFLR